MKNTVLQNLNSSDSLKTKSCSETHLNKEYEALDKKTRPDFDDYKETKIREYLTNDLELKYEPPFPEWCFATIRAILDSKFYEHILYQDQVTGITDLSDFTYSWLGNF